MDLDQVAGFLELHIEQGRVLDTNDDRLGIVTSIRAPVRYRVTVEGEETTRTRPQWDCAEMPSQAPQR